MNDNPVVHFEMPYDDAKRVSDFYNKAFGWEMNVTGEEMSNYITAHTTKTENNMSVTPGAINGGFFSKSTMPVSPNVVISVKDIQAAMDSVKNAGGKILVEVMEIPQVGKYISFTDSEGNRVALLQS